MEIPDEVTKNIDGSKSNKLTITVLIIAVMALFGMFYKEKYIKDADLQTTIFKLEKTVVKLESKIEYLDSSLSDCGKEALKREINRSNILDSRESNKNKLKQKLQ